MVLLSSSSEPDTCIQSAAIKTVYIKYTWMWCTCIDKDKTGDAAEKYLKMIKKTYWLTGWINNALYLIIIKWN